MNDYDLDLLLRNLNYAEIEQWRVGRNIMFYSALGHLKKSIKSPKDLFELEDEIKENSTEATEKQKYLFKKLHEKRARN